MTDPINPASVPPLAPKRSWFRRHPLLTTIVAIPMLVIGSCAFLTRDRTVTWEEEVLLNTGETIWIQRQTKYTVQGAGGNPLDLGYWTSGPMTIKFTWQNKDFVYIGRAEIMLLAISPITLRPVLVAPSDTNRWDERNQYRCRVPSYVQLVPNANGTTWTWPNNIEPWLYGLPSNVMIKDPEFGKIKDRYRNSDRLKLDSLVHASNPKYAVVSPIYVSEDCK